MTEQKYTDDEKQKILAAIELLRPLQGADLDLLITNIFEKLVYCVWRPRLFSKFILRPEEKAFISKLGERTNRLKHDLESLPKRKETSNSQKALLLSASAGLDSLAAYISDSLNHNDYFETHFRGKGNTKKFKSDLELSVASGWQFLGGRISKGKDYEQFFRAVLGPVYARHEEREELGVTTLTDAIFRNHVDYILQLSKEAHGQGMIDPNIATDLVPLALDF